mmetsp:Transcript_13307/g.27904  ORF Transcript_13307/g.27904 Transcript_13307/m.27904 type:complete len:89 (-) Transcript_13307:88-354(-)
MLLTLGGVCEKTLSPEFSETGGLRGITLLRTNLSRGMLMFGGLFEYNFMGTRGALLNSPELVGGLRETGGIVCLVGSNINRFPVELFG